MGIRIGRDTEKEKETGTETEGGERERERERIQERPEQVSWWNDTDAGDAGVVSV